MANKTVGPFRVMRIEKYNGEISSEVVSRGDDEKEVSKVARKMYLDGAYGVKVLDSNDVESLMWCKPIE